MKRKVLVTTGILISFLLGFSLHLKSQSPPPLPQFWTFINSQSLQDGGPYIGEAQSLTGETYVVVWNLNGGIAITPETTTTALVPPTSLAPPTNSVTRQR